MKYNEEATFYMEATENQIKSLIKLYQVGAIPKTIARYANITSREALDFIQMARTGTVKYMSEKGLKYIDIASITSNKYIKNDIEDEWVSESTYGGKQGDFPKFKVLWNYEITIKEYLAFRKGEKDGIDETIIHRDKK